MADPKEEALRTILARKNVTRSGQGTMGPIAMGNSGLPPIQPAVSPLEMAGKTMQGWGENFPGYFSKGPQGGLEGGLQVPTSGGGSLGGSLAVSGEDKRFELMAQNMGVSPQELRMFLAMQGTKPQSLGVSYGGNPLSLSYEMSLPAGNRSVSAGGSYNLPEGGGQLGLQGTYGIDNPAASSMMATYKKRW